jgi:3-oxoacyl-[acyl-carrier-protein] synthase II
MIPPSVNLDQVAEDCTGASFVSASTESDIAAVLTNSFAFGGHNSSLVLRRNDPYRTEE